MPIRHRFTIYDALEAKGVFDANPANAQSRSPDGVPLYTGPVEFPAMFYHPKGERRVIQAGEVVATPFGPKLLGEQTELVWKIANNAAEAAKLVAAGWHDHPAKAMEAGGEEAPATGPGDVIKELQKKLLAAQKQLAEASASAAEEAAMASSTVKPRAAAR